MANRRECKYRPNSFRLAIKTKAEFKVVLGKIPVAFSVVFVVAFTGLFYELKTMANNVNGGSHSSTESLNGKDSQRIMRFNQRKLGLRHNIDIIYRRS